LNREVIDAKTIVKLGPQFAQQIRLRDAVRVNHMRAQRLASGSDRPNVQVVNVVDAVRARMASSTAARLIVRRRALQQHVRRLSVSA
jgi:hypothetical protein